MANLIVVCGPQAVGKMTVAESLRDKLRYNMMMNHDSIEMSDKIFDDEKKLCTYIYDFYLRMNHSSIRAWV